MKTTAKHFELFKEECQKWIEKLNLDDWEVNYWHENPEYYQADCEIQKEATYRRVDIKFTTDRIEKENLNDEYIKGIAKHEMMHLLLGNLSELAYSRYVSRNEIIKAKIIGNIAIVYDYFSKYTSYGKKNRE